MERAVKSVVLDYANGNVHLLDYEIDEDFVNDRFKSSNVEWMSAPKGQSLSVLDEIEG